MERATLNLSTPVIKNICSPVHQLVGRFPGKGKEEHITWILTELNQICYSVDQGAGFTATSTGDHQLWAIDRGDCCKLLFVQFGVVVDLEIRAKDRGPRF